MLISKVGGFCYIVIAWDDLSKYVKAKALKQATTKAIAKFVLKELIFQYGYISHIATNNGPEFQAELSQLLQHYNMPQIPISPYNSQANGVVEQGHFAIQESLVKVCEEWIHEWPKKLKTALFANNITVRRSTRLSAYYLMHRVDMLLPFDLRESTFMIEGVKDRITTKELLALHTWQLEHHEEDIEKAVSILRAAQLAFKAQFEKYVRPMNQEP